MEYITLCHMQVHLSGNYIPAVGSPPKHTSPPSTAAMSRSSTVDFILFYFPFSFFFFFFSSFLFLFLEQLGLGLIGHAVTSVTSWWRSHKLMAKSQDWSQDLGELSRRFENKWRHTTWTPHVDLMDYTWLFRVGCTVASTDHL